MSFGNVCHDSAGASDILLALQQQGFRVGFTFNGVNFARAGETPFLKSYKAKLRRFVDQLDVEDGLFDGTPQPLAQGNTEIKEMVSILSAASFAGFLVLAAGNRAVGTLQETTARLVHLLDTI